MTPPPLWSPVVTGWRPAFGERIENHVYCSPSNPRRFGFFVRAGHTPHGRMNAGPWWELTDGKGEFWRVKPENCRRDRLAPACPHVVTTDEGTSYCTLAAGAASRLAQAEAFLDAWCAAAEDGEPLGPLREQTLGWLG